MNRTGEIHMLLRRSFRKAMFRCIPGLCFLILLTTSVLAESNPRHVSIAFQPDDVIATGNEWIALPNIRVTDGALGTFNVLSMQDRGLLQVGGENGAPVLQPYFEVGGKSVAFQNPAWELIEYWIPTAHAVVNGLDMTLTWCAPPGSRGAFLRMSLTNRSTKPVDAVLGVKASWGSLQRVTYLPVELHGERSIAPATWVDAAETFSFITSDTRFAWSLIHPEASVKMSAPPLTVSPESNARRVVILKPGETSDAVFVIGAGIEEFSASHNARALAELLDRYGPDGVIAEAANWYRQRTRTTGKEDLDLLMNRNFLFSAFYAWGRTIDTEQFVGVTSRSPRYYVSAAYWDRDAMLWSFPALLDMDTTLAREALEYAFTTQLRNTGTHSRFIDGVVLEDGFQLDEAAAPLLAMAQYVERTGDDEFARDRRKAVALLVSRIESHHDSASGLYDSLQDPQDEYRKMPFLTDDNVLLWKTFVELGNLYDRLHDSTTAKEMRVHAEALHAAIMSHCVFADAPGAGGSIFAAATDGKQAMFAEIPPGSLMKLPILGFVAESNPIFKRTYRWLHSDAYQYSYAGHPYGLPGSYRLPFTTSWSIADHLGLEQGRDQAWKVLRASRWDGGIITEGVDPDTAIADSAGRAFATAAGYVADAICRASCQKTAP